MNSNNKKEAMRINYSNWKMLGVAPALLALLLASPLHTQAAELANDEAKLQAAKQVIQSLLNEDMDVVDARQQAAK